jgi:hypothetical protein
LGPVIPVEEPAQQRINVVRDIRFGRNGAGTSHAWMTGP